MSIADNLRRVHERIAAAAEAAGRDASEITLVGVTKYVGVPQARELAAAGCRDLGESRPQELWSKAGELASASGQSVRWHLIGHLQRNKLRRTLPLVHLIHSVDSERLLAAIHTEWQSLTSDSTATTSPPPPIRILIEVNTSGDAAKQGLAPDEVEPLLAAATRFPNVAVCGLMTMAALEGGLAVAARNFAVLCALADRFGLQERSMGMSGDFEVAIREGATIVRVGSALWD